MKRKSYKLCLLVEVQIETTGDNFCHLKCNCMVWYVNVLFAKNAYQMFNAKMLFPQLQYQTFVYSVLVIVCMIFL